MTRYINILTLCTALVTILSSNSISGQSKQDYIWFFGKDQLIDEGIQGLRFDQNNASICTPEGELLFYTNGCAVADKSHQIMPNGDIINAGDIFDVLWRGDCKNGYPGPQDITILQDPSYNEWYYILHKTVEHYPGQTPSTAIESIKYTYIDMALNNGMGDVVEKNIPFAESNSINGYLLSYLSVIAHDNQKDWWIIQPDFDDNLFFTYLLDSNGFSTVDSTRIVGTDFWRNSSASGASTFSPDGNVYAYYNMEEGLWVYDFDRTTGVFSNERSLIVPQDPDSFFSGLEFSPNSRFIYLCDANTVFQVDLIENNLEDGKVLIATYEDSELDLFGTRFFKSALGPDCRISIRGSSGSKFMHLIHKPDEKGLDCDFELRGLVFSQFTSTGSFPNFPRYRVDEAEVCNPTIDTYIRINFT